MENEIIKSLLEEKSKLEKEFNELEIQARNIEIGKERVRGAYIVIVDQLKKFNVIKDEVKTDEQPKQEEQQPKKEDAVVEEQPKADAETKPKETKKVAEKKVEQPKADKTEKQGIGLTPEEIEKINKAVTKPKAKVEKKDEIPEYLQSEYNK